MRAALPQNQNLSDMKKKIYRPISFMDADTKILSKILAIHRKDTS
jgi:uncharacterized protein (UPF0335 family)